MAYDRELADRLRELVQGEPRLSERAMFGGLAFLIGGNMAVAAAGGGGLLLRVDPRATDHLIRPPHVERFVMRGRAMDGWLRVDPEAIGTDQELAEWAWHGLAFARSLPAKS